ncbi:MAG TPA: hypothetical protein VJ760_08385, partial [Nitrospiraceae bacterium]|nr:hypothetical protein [Nitrospiraceae bacterium]
MKTLRHRNLVLLVGICCVVVCCLGLVEPARAASSPQTSSSPDPTKRWAQFGLNQAESMGDPQTGKPVTLMIALGGVAASSTPVVAICESIVF